MNQLLANIIHYASNFVYLYPLLMTFIWLIGGLIFYWRREHGIKEPPILKEYPFFSVLIPCHNEELLINETVTQLLKLDYPDYEIILIDDGSTDKTASKIHDLCERHKKVRAAYQNENRGKAAALNTGGLIAKGEFLLTLDADALLDTEALKWMAWHFHNFPRVGAVTGNPRVLNRSTLLAKIQIGEYSTIIGLIKRTQRIWGKVLTVSGVIAAFRRQALVTVGFWDTDMVTEDIDVTWKLERRFWDIRYEPHAVCWIRVPATIKGLWRQRLRWAQGGMEVLRRHWDIWQDWRQRRLFPVYLEYIFTTIWAYVFWAMVVWWGVDTFSKVFFATSLPVTVLPPIPPRWTGSVLAFVCLLQFAVSLFLDRSHDKKMFRYMFWVIWYPFLYWMINALAVIVGTPKALFKKRGTPAIWSSSDRGIDKL